MWHLENLLSLISIASVFCKVDWPSEFTAMRVTLKTEALQSSMLKKYHGSCAAKKEANWCFEGEEAMIESLINKTVNVET